MGDCCDQPGREKARGDLFAVCRELMGEYGEGGAKLF